MALSHASGATNYAYTTTNVPTSGAWTMMAWVRVTGTLGTTFRSIMGYGATTGVEYGAVYLDNGGAADWGVYAEDNGTFSGQTPVASTWYHVCLRYTGSAVQLVLNGTQIASQAATLTPTSPRFSYGGNPRYGQDGGLASQMVGMKGWSGVSLTDAQVTEEMRRLIPVRWENLHHFLPGIATDTAAVRDSIAGNTQRWTENNINTADATVYPGVGYGASPIIFPFVSAAPPATPTLRTLLQLGVGR